MRRGRIILLLMLGLILIPSAGFSVNFPTKPITYMVCFNPGGESDITARIQERALEKYLGVDVVITYKIGAGGAICWSELIRSKPDGYTIAGDNLPHIILQPLMRKDAGYKTLDLKQIYIFESTPNVLVVHKDSQFKTLQDFIKYAKEHPGVVTVGGSGSNTANHLGTVLLEKAAGIKLTYIPFSGSGTAVPALLGKHVTALMTYSTMAVRYKDQFRPLAIAAEKRMEVLPDVPTFKELGYNIVEGAYRGAAAPPGTPDEIIKVLANAFDNVMREPEVIRKMNENGFKIEYMGPEEATALVKRKMKEYKKLLKEMGLLKK